MAWKNFNKQEQQETILSPYQQVKLILIKLNADLTFSCSDYQRLTYGGVPKNSNAAVKAKNNLIVALMDLFREVRNDIQKKGDSEADSFKFLEKLCLGQFTHTVDIGDNDVFLAVRFLKDYMYNSGLFDINVEKDNIYDIIDK